jgi:two-component system sensor histidine kinase UhpB
LKRLISVQEQERKRVARELHDDLGQSLSSTTLNIEIAQRALNDDPQTTATHLKRALSLIAESTDQMYDLILGLRPSVLDDFGLISALRAHCQRTLEPANITFDLDTQGLPDRLPPEIETALFRIFQEALTNVLRHAKASHVVLRLIKEDGVVVGQILDDGVGFDPDMFTEQKGEPRGLGLLGIHERVEQRC